MRCLKFFAMNCLAALVAGGSPNTTSAAMLESTQLYGWTVGAYSRGNSGQFSHCGAGVPYQSGIYLIFAIDRTFSWSMSFASEDWQLTPGARIPISYQIDNSGPIHATAVVMSRTVATVTLNNSVALFDEFRRGYHLRVGVRGKVFTFPLTNSSKVLAAALECTYRYVNPAGRRPDMFASGSATPKQRPSEGKLQAEAAAVAANVLAAAGIEDFRLGDTIPAELDMFHAIWWSPNAMGGVRIEERESLDSATATLIASATKSCPGAFASMKLPSDQLGAVRLKTICSGKKSGGTSSVQYTNIVERKRGGIIIFAIYELPDSEGAGAGAERAGEQLFDASLRVVK